MESTLEWLANANAALSDTRKETEEWEKKRVGTVAEVDGKLASKHAELGMLTSSAKARAKAALELAEEGGGERSEPLKKKKKRGKLGKLTAMKETGGDGGDGGGARGKGEKERRASTNMKRGVKSTGGKQSGGKLMSGNLNSVSSKGTVVHKSTTNLNGVYHLVVVRQTDGHVIFEATDQESKNVYSTRTKAKASVVRDKTIKEKEFYYENLIKRLAFKKRGGEGKGDGPRFMQKTGVEGEKKLVFLKLSENNISSVNINNNRGTPFFKQQLPIGDIIADVTASNNFSDRTTTINFYDSIYNCQTAFTFPTCALADFNSTDFKPKGGGGGGGGIMKKAALGAVVDVRAEYVKNVCAAIIVTRGDEEDEAGNITLFHHIPQYVQKVIEKAVRKDEAAVAIQSIARKMVMYNSFKPKMMKIKIEQTAVKRIQARARGMKVREGIKRPKMEYRAAKLIETRIRGILARRRVEEMREEVEAALVLQSQARAQAARAKVDARRKLVRLQVEERSACLLQGQIRQSLARKRVGEIRTQKKSATVLQTKFRQTKAKAVVGRKRQERSAAVLIQGRARMRKASLKVEVRREYVRDLQNNAAVLVQRNIRARNGRNKVRGMRMERDSAIVLQGRMRMSLARQEVGERRSQRNAAIKLQGKLRQQASMKIIGRKRKERNAAIVLQGRARIRRAQVRVEARREYVRDLHYNAAVAVQRNVRAREGRKQANLKRMQRDSAIVLQNRMRQSLARQEVNDRRTERFAAIKLQSKMRQGLARNVVAERREQRNAATLLQGQVRIRQSKGRAKARREYRKDLQNNLERDAAVLLQSQMRMALSRQEAGKRRERKWACVALQCKVRQVQATSYTAELRKIRDNILAMQLQIREFESIIIIQKIVRAFVARRVVMRMRADWEEMEREKEDKRKRAKRMERAVVDVQKRIRIYNAKALLGEKRQERVAAVALQCLCRVRQSKRRVEAARKVAADEELARQEEERQRRSSAIVVQCAFRTQKSNKIRKVLAMERMGAVVLQCMYRSRVAMREVKSRAATRDRMLKEKVDEEERVRLAAVLEQRRITVSASVKIQSKMRQCLSRWAVREVMETKRLKRSMAIRIQAVWRKKDAKEKFIHLIKMHNAALFIQVQARIMSSKKERQRRKLMKDDLKWNNMIRIQCASRQLLSRWKARDARERKDSVLCIQRAARVFVAKERLKDMRFMHGLYIKKVVLVQSIWRRRTAVLWWKQWRDWWEWEKANAIMIQKIARGYKARREMKEYLAYWHEFEMASRIQKRWRGCSCRKNPSPVFLSWVKHAPHLLEDLIGWEATFNDPEPPVYYDACGNEWVWDVNCASRYGENLLMAAAGVGNKDVVTSLVERGRCDKDAYDGRGDTAAHYAFRHGFADLGYYMVDDLGCDDTIENGKKMDCYAVAGAVNEKRPNMYMGDEALGSNISVEYG